MADILTHGTAAAAKTSLRIIASCYPAAIGIVPVPSPGCGPTSSKPHRSSGLWHSGTFVSTSKNWSSNKNLQSTLKPP